MEEHRRTSLLGHILHGLVTGLLVTGAVGVLAYGHSEYLAELCPVGHVVALVYDIRGYPCQSSQGAFLPDKEHRVVILQRFPRGVLLPVFYQPPHRVIVLSGNEPVVHPSAPVLIELEQGEPPEVRVYQVSDEPVEPGGAQQGVDPLVRNAVPSELDLRALHGRFPLLYDAARMPVHKDVLIEVIQPRPLCEVHIVRPPDGLHIVRHILHEQPGCGDDDCSRGVPARKRHVAAYGYLFLPCHFNSVLHVWDCFLSGWAGCSLPSPRPAGERRLC